MTLSLAAYEVDEIGRYWLWIQKRGQTKPTYVARVRCGAIRAVNETADCRTCSFQRGPGLWDMTANGGLPAHLSPVEGVLEEAGQ